MVAVAESPDKMIALLREYPEDTYILVARSPECFKHLLLKYLPHTKKLVNLGKIKICGRIPPTLQKMQNLISDEVDLRMSVVSVVPITRYIYIHIFLSLSFLSFSFFLSFFVFFFSFYFLDTYV